MGDVDEFLHSGVFRTFAAGMPFVVARAADFHFAPLASAKLPASVGAAAGIEVDMCKFDLGAPTPCGALDAVLDIEFSKLPIPSSLEIVVEELNNMLTINNVCCAAFRWHVLFVGRCNNKNLAEAGSTPAV